MRRHLECQAAISCESHPEKTNPRAHADMPVDKPCSNQYDWDIELKSKDAAIRAWSVELAAASKLQIPAIRISRWVLGNYGGLINE